MPQLWLDIVTSASNRYCSLVIGWTDLLIACDFGYAPRRRLSLVVIIKIRSFNQQHHRADIASNSTTAAMPVVRRYISNASNIETIMSHLNTLHKLLNYLAQLPKDRLATNEKIIFDLGIDNDSYTEAKFYLSTNGYVDGGKTHISLTSTGRLKFAEIKKQEEDEIYETVFDNFDYTLFRYFFNKGDFMALSEIPQVLKSNVPEKIGLNDFPISNYLLKKKQYFDFINKQYRINENGKQFYFKLKKDMENKQQVVQNIINADNGSVVNVGNNNTIKIIFNKPGDQGELIEKLKELKIQQEEINELLEFIETEKPNSKESDFGTKTKSWLAKMFNKSIDGTWQIGIATAGGVLVEIIKKYYGF